MSRIGKRRLATLVAERAELSKAAAARALEAAFEAIASELAKGNTVTVPGFGSWHIRVHAPRAGRDPQSGRPLAIPPRTKVSFRPGTRLRERAEASIDPEIFYGEGVAAGTELNSVFAQLFGLNPATLDIEQFRRRLRDVLGPNADREAKEFFAKFASDPRLDELLHEFESLAPRSD